ncbi:MAG TPA: hypothetical protein VHI93_05705 [Candidatus Thermoplasmatota archaeon]|nr:hypothetical protein [Candidatus Thermoplasmatota archaeon]
MAERKSQPRKSNVVVDEEAQKRRDRFRLGVLLVGGLAVVELMGIVAGFLSNTGVPTWLYYALGTTVALGAVIYLVGRFAAPVEA